METARRGYELWNEEELPRFLELFHPDLVFTTSGMFPGFDPVYRGREGMARFAETMLEAWESLELEPNSIDDLGDYVLIPLRFRGKGRASGVETATDFHHLLHFRDGLIDRLIAHPDRAAVLEAAGLSE